jgi:ABC-2 type transport system ATP-binding protein
VRADVVAELAGTEKRFGSTVALRGLDLQVNAGELLSVLGPNGAGKSTAIALLLGLLRPDKGYARLFGRPPGDIEAHRQVGVMLQDASLTPELRVRELIALTTRYYPSPLSVDEALAISNTMAIADRPYGKLSGGQKRQAQFAIAICGRPRLLFLDEPTASLDVQARELMWATLRRLVAQGVSIVLTTHHLDEAEHLADRVAVLAQGQLVALGAVPEIRALVTAARIDCITALDVKDVASWPHVSSASRDERGVHVTTTHGVEVVVRRLLATDEHLTGLEVRRAGLSEALAHLTVEKAS